MSKSEGRKIISLTASNIKRLKAVRIEPDGNLVVISGNNAQGKSSVLDTIVFILGGKSIIPGEPLRRGTKKGEGSIDLGEGLIATRKFTKGGTELEVVDQNEPQKSPQAILDKLVGKLSFDPLEFQRMESKKQIELLRKLVGLDFTELDRKRAKAYENRTLTNRDLKSKQAQVDAIPEVKGLWNEEVSIKSLSDKLNNALQTNQDNDRMRQSLTSLSSTLSELKTKGEGIKEKIVVLTKDLEDLRTLHSQKKEEYVTLVAKVEELEDIPIEPIQTEMANIEKTNSQIRKQQEREKLELELESLQLSSDNLTQEIEDIDSSKVDQLTQVKFPVPNLTLDEEIGITLNGFPLNQASGAESIIVSSSIALAMNPTLRICLIRDGSLLDTNTLTALSQWADENNCQIWIERVEIDGFTSVVIEDGEVKE